MKKVLIISPHFPPSNAADMHRIRMSLPYFSKFGWDAEVVIVDEKYSDIIKDDLLLQSVPPNIKVHRVQAFNKKWTRAMGLGSLALRSLWFYRQKVNQLLKDGKYDLIFFSTTQFPVCILGGYWKKRFGIPYIIDMQDPWYSDYYRDKPSSQRPRNFHLTYAMHKRLEAIALKQVDGLMSVSDGYISELKKRYPEIKNIPSATITFGAFEDDLKIAGQNCAQFTLLLNSGSINIVYVGRGGYDMHKAIVCVFEAFKQGLKEHTEFERIKFYFIGTSYALTGEGEPTILPLAKELGIEKYVIEITDRISYYHTLCTLSQANALFIPGSDDPNYSASKIYSYLLTHKPILAMFNANSPLLNILHEYGLAYAYSYDSTTDIRQKINDFLINLINNNIPEQVYNPAAIKKYSAGHMTGLQCQLFDAVLSGKV